jgi:hypothetical protein
MMVRYERLLLGGCGRIRLTVADMNEGVHEMFLGVYE